MVKSLPAVQRPGFNAWAERCPGGVKGKSFQYSCLGNPIDRGAWRAVVHGVSKLGTTAKLTHIPSAVTLPCKVM